MKIIQPSQTLKDLHRLYRNGFRPGGSTGWKSLDAMWTVGEAQLTVITGIPSHGKSSWLDALMVNQLDRPLYGKRWQWIVCSPEQEPLEQHEAELIERIVGKRFRKGEGRMTWEEAQEVAVTKLNDHFRFLKLDDSDTFVDLLECVHSLCSKDPDAQWGVVLDPWNRLEHRRPTHMNESEYISEALSAAVRVKSETRCHLFIVAHPAKLQRDKSTGERPVPSPYDISGAAHWFNKPDNCLTVWRDPTADDPIARRTRVYVQKVRWRHIGKAGDFIELDFDPATGRFIDPNDRMPTASIDYSTGELVDL